MKHRLPKRFTVFEIIIVVITIGLLLTMSMPALIWAHDNSQNAACANDLKLIITTKTAHALDQRGNLGGTNADPSQKIPSPLAGKSTINLYDLPSPNGHPSLLSENRRIL